MLPNTYPSEIRTFADPLTGRQITQLTNSPGYDNIHLYFTENAFTRGGREIYFSSDRDTPGIINVFSVNRDTGLITRVTDYTDAGAYALTKNPESTSLLYVHGREAVLHSLPDGEKQVLYVYPEGYSAGRISLNCDHTLVGLLMNEDIGVYNGPNYAGFAERFYRIKRSQAVFVPLEDEGVRPCKHIIPGKPYIGMRETCETGHLQFSPVDPKLCMYCHEGPWHLVNQRIFLLNAGTLEIVPCFRQDKDDSVGHEFWLRDGNIFFDNRGPGHDGSITSYGVQAVATEPVGGDFIPYTGIADPSGNVLRTTPLNQYLNHYHCGSDINMLVGDGKDDLIRVGITREGATMDLFCRHGTSWRTDQTHCHPTISWDDDAVLYASDATGKTQLYLTDWPD